MQIRDRFYKNNTLFLLERRKRGRMKIVLLLFALFLILAITTVLTGFYVFRNYWEKPSERTAELTIEGMEEIATGSDVNYTLRYQNTATVAFNNVSLVAHLSSGFVDVQSEPSFEISEQNTRNELVWNINTIESGATGSITLKAKLVAPPASVQYLNSDLFYSPSNFTSVLKESEIFNIIVKPSPIEFNLVGMSEILIDEEGEFGIEYRNTGNEELKDIKFDLMVPDHFSIMASEPALIGKELAWKIDSVPAGVETKLKIMGKFTKLIEGGEKITAKLFVLGKDAYFLADERILNVKVETTGIVNLNLLLNGTTEDDPVFLGDEVSYSLVYENNSGRELRHLEVVAELEPSVFELIDVQTLKNQFTDQVTQNETEVTIIWSEKNDKNLLAVAHGGKGVINFSLRLAGKDILKKISLKTAQSLSLKSSLAMLIPQEISSDGDQRTVKATRISSKSFTTLINTDLSFIAERIGPIENTVHIEGSEEKLSFEMVWRLNNTLHEVNNLSINSTLPDAVSWENLTSISAGDISFDAQTRAVRWTLNRLPAELDQGVVIHFQVSIPPRLGELGQNLTNEATLKAGDSITKDDIVIKVPETSYKESSVE